MLAYDNTHLCSVSPSQAYDVAVVLLKEAKFIPLLLFDTQIYDSSVKIVLAAMRADI